MNFVSRIRYSVQNLQVQNTNQRIHVVFKEFCTVLDIIPIVKYLLRSGNIAAMKLTTDEPGSQAVKFSGF